jgi:8-oxo-dGTP pyrophosphatase MutT (NUDIX family)
MAYMGLSNHALYQVATKALIMNGDKLLVLETPDGYADFPGGRVDETERDVPWADALRREIAEEVGPDVQVEVGPTVFVSKRQYTRDGQTHHIAAIYFACRYLGGDIVLSDEHAKYEWLTPAELLVPDRTFISADEQTQLQHYFASA